MQQLTTNDALGGQGSIPQQLGAIVVGGLSRAVDGILSKKFPLGSFNDTATINAAGQVRNASEPAKSQTAGEAALGVLKNPIVIGIGVAVLVSLALFAAFRR